MGQTSTVRFAGEAPAPTDKDDRKHDHDHDHEDVMKQLNQEHHPPEPGFLFRAVNGLLYQGSKAYVHTRYSKVGNTVAQEFLDTRGLVAGRYNRQRTYVGQLLLGLVNVLLSCRDWLIETAIDWFDVLVFLAIFVLDQILATAWALFRWLPLHSLAVYGSLVLGGRCFWAFAREQSWPYAYAALAAAVYVGWAAFVSWNYLARPRDWDPATWPKRPVAVAHSVLGWWKSAVFWNVVGLGFTLWAQSKGFTGPLFPETYAY
ncbi:uncharacterized protein PG986_011728 [Apiospora aurea]|uniref:Uncharacterized protein n=1 Tax=Apiospora aurea TaxID=335848 RepID=A0ABR1PY01_9PEZI